MRLNKTTEDYLKTIYIISQNKGGVYAVGFFFSVNKKEANEDACRFEHAVSPKSLKH